MSGMYSIGADEWPGLSKLIEEAGEIIQVGGKILGTGGQEKHWDGTNLRERMIEELADLYAAIKFFVGTNLTQEERREWMKRADQKRELFYEWRKIGDPAP